MRIGLIAPPWLPVPPPGYGGTEVVIDDLARALQARGHEVTLFTVGESTCPVERRYLYDTAAEPMGVGIDEAAHLLAAYDALGDMDVIHDHTMLGPLLAANLSHPRPPIVTTCHGVFTAVTRRIFAEVARHSAVVAISHDQARRATGIPLSAVVHHGIDLELFRPGPGDGGYLLFLGRMSPDKGAHRAVRIARESGYPLLLAAKMREPGELAYFEEVVRPMLGQDDDLAVEPPVTERLEMLRRAAALINPISWPEPFGLVMVEALATATPVLAFANGAAPEVVEHGCTGFLSRTEHDMIVDLGHLNRIDRAACRRAAELRFSMHDMAQAYQRVYNRVLDRPTTARAGTLVT